VTIDAMGSQKGIAADIIDGAGEYLLAVKENQPHPYEDIGRAFDEALDRREPGVDFDRKSSPAVSLDFIGNKDSRANSPGFLGQIPYF
jgi:hypothetical protein